MNSCNVGTGAVLLGGTRSTHTAVSMIEHDVRPHDNKQGENVKMYSTFSRGQVDETGEMQNVLPEGQW